MTANVRVFTNTGLKMPKLSTETEREKRQTLDLRTSTPCLQIQCCRKCGKGNKILQLKFIKMTQLENVTQELNLIQFGFMKLNNTLQILHSSKSDEDLIKQMQDDQIELFNEFTLKVQELRGDFLSNLEGIGMLLEEDYNYINSVNELINSPS